jgi:hypothetical protein
MLRILLDVLRGLAGILFPTKPPFRGPKLCQCSTCGQWHYGAIQR